MHKQNCPNAVSLQSKYAYRILPAKWIDSSQQVYTSQIQLSGIDNLGLVNEVTSLISEILHVKIKNINFTTDEGVFKGKITQEVKKQAMHKKTITKTKKIERIEKGARE